MGDISRRSSTQQLSRESGTFMASDERGQGSWNRNPRWGERRSPDEGSFQSTGAGAWAEVRLTSPDSRQLCVWGRSAQAEGGSRALQDARRLSARLCVPSTAGAPEETKTKTWSQKQPGPQRQSLCTQPRGAGGWARGPQAQGGGALLTGGVWACVLLLNPRVYPPSHRADIPSALRQQCFWATLGSLSVS